MRFLTFIAFGVFAALTNAAAIDTPLQERSCSQKGEECNTFLKSGPKCCDGLKCSTFTTSQKCE
ncbi:hypothetical protein NUU61_007381 [Penicillium alfredii]|uniref:Uncharacterized protein n=1 Tax=Penicillium alfredii TaxID=1506179 RepID=A0A9W9F2S2_9EURO|nr:uncharacterized protein NUU61_007381 [Penicillium alfredii]KAJ5092511.1 hypothetical protein NUU61_007381 [Penicillium alfredii]